MLNQRSKFSLDEQFVYLNGAYMSPQLKSVEKAGINALRRKNIPHQVTGEHFFNESHELRKAYSKLINVLDPNRVVLIPSVSYGMANIAKNLSLGPKENIIIVDEQFPSNVYPWMEVTNKSGAELRIIKAPDTQQDRGKKWNEAILDSIDVNTRLVALGHIHWADGTIYDLKAIRERSREVGALLVIDGTQSVGALPFDVQEYEPDALICAGYKWLMGPYSIGLAYYGEAFDDGSPIEQNWINRLESEDFSKLVNYQDAYQPAALRYEVGEHSNFNLVPMMKAAIDQLLVWDISEIQKYTEDITAKAVNRLRESGFYIENDDYRAFHLFGIRLPNDALMNSVKEALMNEQIIVSYRGDCIRVSPNVYNTEAEMDTLASTLESVLALQP